MSSTNFDTAIIDKVALDLASELEKTAICDVVATLVNQEVTVQKPEDFWAAAVTALMIRGFNRSAAEVHYLFEKCHKEGRQVVDVRAYIKSKIPKVGDYPARIPEFNEPGFVNEDERKRLQGIAAAALAVMGEGDESKEAEDGAKEMSFRGK